MPLKPFSTIKATRVGPRALLLRTAGSSLLATLTSTAALAFVARANGKGAAQPLNATSHWLYGAKAADFRDADVDHTPVGLATHAAATLLWAACFETSIVLRPPRNAAGIARIAVATAALAALVDYTITPRRFTPGWELVVGKASLAAVYAAMAAGFAASALGTGR